ncbi:hypothetical protein [Microbacterium sp.]|uniref:hypothetical protein n=1 Tax=Microbacterium sp. TaxID=51671 RepID=UPI0037CC0447
MGGRKRRLWHATPWDGQRGFWAAWNRLVFQIEGTAQLGDPNEPAYVPPADPRCPLCAAPMDQHRIHRVPGKSTSMTCPPARQAA